MQALVWWVRDVVVTGVREVTAFDDWLTDKRYLEILTQAQWEDLISTTRSAPGWAARGAGALAQGLIEELVNK